MPPMLDRIERPRADAYPLREVDLGEPFELTKQPDLLSDPFPPSGIIWIRIGVTQLVHVIMKYPKKDQVNMKIQPFSSGGGAKPQSNRVYSRFWAQRPPYAPLVSGINLLANL